jgi:hypothetical protein
MEYAKGAHLASIPRLLSQASGHRSKEILGLVHLDVGGPMSVGSITRSIYYVSFIDDFSRKTWIYFLKTKHEVFSKFREFKALVKSQTRTKIRVLRLDNGGEGFCKEAQIKMELTVPYNP